MFKPFESSIWNGKQNSLTGPVITGNFEKRASDFLWSCNTVVYRFTINRFYLRQDYSLFQVKCKEGV